jgi:hypothetical protein
MLANLNAIAETMKTFDVETKTAVFSLPDSEVVPCLWKLPTDPPQAVAAKSNDSSNFTGLTAGAFTASMLHRDYVNRLIRVTGAPEREIRSLAARVAQLVASNRLQSDSFIRPCDAIIAMIRGDSENMSFALNQASGSIPPNWNRLTQSYDLKSRSFGGWAINVKGQPAVRARFTFRLGYSIISDGSAAAEYVVDGLFTQDETMPGVKRDEDRFVMASSDMRPGVFLGTSARVRNSSEGQFSPLPIANVVSEVRNSWNPAFSSFALETIEVVPRVIAVKAETAGVGSTYMSASLCESDGDYVLVQVDWPLAPEIMQRVLLKRQNNNVAEQYFYSYQLFFPAVDPRHTSVVGLKTSTTSVEGSYVVVPAFNFSKYNSKVQGSLMAPVGDYRFIPDETPDVLFPPGFVDSWMGLLSPFSQICAEYIVYCVNHLRKDKIIGATGPNGLPLFAPLCYFGETGMWSYLVAYYLSSSTPRALGGLDPQFAANSPFIFRFRRATMNLAVQSVARHLMVHQCIPIFDVAYRFVGLAAIMGCPNWASVRGGFLTELMKVRRPEDVLSVCWQGGIGLPTNLVHRSQVGINQR